MEVAFTILQTKHVAIRAVDLSPSMDVIAFVQIDGTLVALRTLSWEKLFSKSPSELYERECNPNVIKFCHSGKLLGIGCANGDIGVIDIQNVEYKPSYARVINFNAMSLYDSPIINIAWQHRIYNETYHIIPDLLKDNKFNKLSPQNILKRGGLNLAERFGMLELHESSASTSSDKDDIFQLESLFAGAAMDLMLTISQDGILNGLIFGIYPFFSIDLSNISSSLINNKILLLTEPLMCSSSYDVNGIVLSSSLEKYSDSNNSSDINMAFIVPMFETLTGRYTYHQQCCQLSLIIQSDVNKLADIVSNASKKWKEATRVIVPKLSLLQDTLDGYELAFTPVEFMYTVSLCGQWHPAAQAAFPSHWNEQGLARLKSAIDLTSIAIIKMLQMRAIPICTNILLRSRELLGLIEMLYGDPNRRTKSSNGNNTQTNSVDKIDKLVGDLIILSSAAEKTLFKIDETLHEARLARESMLLFIQFIKENSMSQDSPQAQNFKPDLSLRDKYIKLFDSRVFRAADKGPSAQGECVTGTHLYAYLGLLTDQDLPHQIRGRVVAHLEDVPQTNANVLDNIQKIVNLTDDWAMSKNGSMSSECANKLSTLEKTCCTNSLAKQIKILKESFGEVFNLTFAHNSEILARTFQNHFLAHDNNNHNENNEEEGSPVQGFRISRDSSIHNVNVINNPFNLILNKQSSDNIGNSNRSQHVVTAVVCSDTIFLDAMSAPLIPSRASAAAVWRNVLLTVIVVDTSASHGQEIVVVIVCKHEHEGNLNSRGAEGAAYVGRLSLNVMEKIENIKFYVKNKTSSSSASDPTEGDEEEEEDKEVEEEDGIQVQTPSLVFTSRSAATAGSIHLCRLELDQVTFAEHRHGHAHLFSVHSLHLPDLLTSASGCAVQHVSSEHVRRRELPLGQGGASTCNAYSLETCGSRGVVMVWDSLGHVLVLDMEADQEEEEEEDEEEEEGEQSDCSEMATDD